MNHSSTMKPTTALFLIPLTLFVSSVYSVGHAAGLVMKNTGHDMPVKFNADVKAWVLKQLTQ